MRISDLAHRITKTRTGVFAATAALIAAIALVDRKVVSNISLGFAYVFPMLIAGYFLTRWRVFLLAVACAVLRETFAPWAWQANALVRCVQAGTAYFGVAVFVAAVVRAQRRAEQEAALRREAEEQLRVLIESSPAAIFLLDAAGRILSANEAAHRLLACDSGSLPGRPIPVYLPVLAQVLSAGAAPRFIRSTVECTGRRHNDEPFLAQIWFSSYPTSAGARVAAIVCDASEELRDREDVGLHSVLAVSQVVVLAMLHEIRNLCAAASVAHANLGRLHRLEGSEDYRALGTLVHGLEKLAASELRTDFRRTSARVDLAAILDELRVLIESPFREAGVHISWKIRRPLPSARGDHHAILQVFLNLSQNSLRAMSDAARKELTVHACPNGSHIQVRFEDTGCGVPVPDRLFQPLQPGAEATGLGLYISRAIVRSFEGDLRYEPQPVGSCFVVQLASA